MPTTGETTSVWSDNYGVERQLRFGEAAREFPNTMLEIKILLTLKNTFQYIGS